jgi:predicted NBD/HSP70 family sugar kinase
MALASAAQDAIDRGNPTLLAKLPAPVDAASITAAAREGDAVAIGILSQAGEHLGRGISYLLNVLNPEMVVLGGPVAEAGELLIDRVRASVAHHALVPNGVTIVPSRLGDRAELTGAVLLAMDQTQGSYRIVGPMPRSPYAAPISWDD